MSDAQARLYEYRYVATTTVRAWIGGLWLSWMFFLGAAVAWGKLPGPWAALLFPLVTLFIAIRGEAVSRRWDRLIAQHARVAKAQAPASGPSSVSMSGGQGVSLN